MDHAEGVQCWRPMSRFQPDWFTSFDPGVPMSLMDGGSDLIHSL
jgi:hypothetical protein